MPIILVIERWKQGDCCQLWAILDYIVRSCLNLKKTLKRGLWVKLLAVQV